MADGSSPSPNQSPSSTPPSSTPPSSDSSLSPPPSTSPPPPSKSSSSPPPPPPSLSPPPPNSSSSPPPPPPSPSSEEYSSPPPPPSPPPQGSLSQSPPKEGGKNQPPPINPSTPGGNEGEGNRSGPTTPQYQPALPGATFNPPSPSLTDGSRTNGSIHNNNTAVVASVVVFSSIILVWTIVCIVCIKKKKKKAAQSAQPYGWDAGATMPPQGNQNSTAQDHVMNMPPSGGYGYPPMGSNVDGKQQLSPSPNMALGFNKSTFTYEELAAATNGFDKAYLLGQGGFGYVHKGVLPNGKEIAVKSLKIGSGQGEREFQAEVDIISRVHHRHLVSLVGYCIASGQRMLVYEFVPNDTLEFHLHKKGELDFPTRLRIALGGAKGLAYLHEDCHPRIIHRDIKASNILLDENYEAMVADFGLAKLTIDTNTHVSTRVMGTFGYLAPEYASSGKLTEKSDVFSFGVMLLEIITGRRPIDSNMQYMEDSLVDWSRPLLAKSLDTGNYDEFVDPRMEGNYDPHLMKRLVVCAAAAIRHSAKKRPKMSQIVRALEGDVSLDNLNDGAKLGMSSSEASLDDYDSRAYSADLKKFRQMAFETQDFASNEYGGTTSEH